MVPFVTMEVSPEGGGFQVSSSSGNTDELSEVRGVFSYRDLLSTSGCKSRVNTIAYIFEKSLR